MINRRQWYDRGKFKEAVEDCFSLDSNILLSAFYMLKPGLGESTTYFVICIYTMKQDLEIDDEATL